MKARYSQLKGDFGSLQAADGPQDVNMNVNADGSISSTRIIEIEAEDLKNPSVLLEKHGFDPSAWKLISAKNNYWQMPKGHKQGGGILTLYQSKITAGPIGGELTIEAIDTYFDELKKGLPKRKTKPKQYKKNGEMLEVIFADLHVGLKPEEGSNVIKERVEHTVTDILARAAGRSFEKVILVFLGDTLHFDTFGKTTTKGALQDTDMSPQEMVDATCDLVLWIVDQISEIAPLEVLIVPGNHDATYSYVLCKAIDYYFKDDSLITVDTNHKSRTWRVWGNCLIGWCHGNIAKARVGKWLHIEAREEYGQTLFAEIHAGHIHHQVTQEDNGVILRYIPALSQTYRWLYDNAYIGALESTCCFVWSKERGLRDQWYTNA